MEIVDLLRGAAQQAFARDVAAYVAVSGIASFAACIVVNALAYALGSTARKEMQLSGHFRSVNDPLFLYPVTGAPFAIAFALAFLRFAVSDPKTVDWTVDHGVAFGLAAWLAGAFHGVILDYTTFKMSSAVLLNFWLGSVTLAVVNGALLGYFF